MSMQTTTESVIIARANTHIAARRTVDIAVMSMRITTESAIIAKINMRIAARRARVIAIMSMQTTTESAIIVRTNMHITVQAVQTDMPILRHADMETGIMAEIITEIITDPFYEAVCGAFAAHRLALCANLHYNKSQNTGR